MGQKRISTESFGRKLMTLEELKDYACLHGFTVEVGFVSGHPIYQLILDEEIIAHIRELEDVKKLIYRRHNRGGGVPRINRIRLEEHLARNNMQIVRMDPPSGNNEYVVTRGGHLRYIAYTLGDIAYLSDYRLQQSDDSPLSIRARFDLSSLIRSNSNRESNVRTRELEDEFFNREEDE